MGQFRGASTGEETPGKNYGGGGLCGLVVTFCRMGTLASKFYCPADGGTENPKT